MVHQALLEPGDIVIADRNCHKSHHYGMVLAGAQPYYVEAFPMVAYSMYGAVPLRNVKKALLDLKAAGRLDKVKTVTLTNCTFDGHVYDVRRVMEECLAIKPDLIFLWDEAWFGYARFSPFHRRRTGMAGAEAIAERVRKRVEGTTLTSSGIRATVSIGIAALDVQDREYSVWIAHADRALYAAKERGRNRSVRYPAG
jgi:arginine decarboxylase